MAPQNSPPPGIPLPLQDVPPLWCPTATLRCLTSLRPHCHPENLSSTNCLTCRAFLPRVSLHWLSPRAAAFFLWVDRCWRADLLLLFLMFYFSALTLKPDKFEDNSPDLINLFLLLFLFYCVLYFPFSWGHHIIILSKTTHWEVHLSLSLSFWNPFAHCQLGFFFSEIWDMYTAMSLSSYTAFPSPDIGIARHSPSVLIASKTRLLENRALPWGQGCRSSQANTPSGNVPYSL